MTHSELSQELAKALLLKEGNRKLVSFKTFLCIRNYFDEMTMEELLGVATQNGIHSLISF